MTTKNTVTRYIGKCPICEGDFKLTADKRMVHHGYQRPGHGSIEGDCRAVGEPPYEVSCEVTKMYRGGLMAHVERCEAWLRKAFAGEVMELHYTPAWPRNAPTTLVRKGDETWPKVLADHMRDTESDIRYTGREIERLTRLVDVWEPRSLRTVEEDEAAAREVKDAAKAKRVADKEAKLVAKIASYQKRLDTAVRKRNPRTIADIFESAQRSLRDMVSCSRSQALAMLGRDHVFAAFDLDPAAGDSYNGPNGKALLNMRTSDWDKSDFTWPEGLK